MPRTIKFRYVLKVYNTSRDDPAYYEWLELPIFTLSELEHNGLDKWILKNVEGIIETIAKNQYTGLRDKNGKEIYEGDVVRMRALIFGHFEPMVGYVYYESPSFVVIANEPRDVMGKGRLLDERNLNEIIGNIYENPELLSNAVDSGK